MPKRAIFLAMFVAAAVHGQNCKSVPSFVLLQKNYRSFVAPPFYGQVAVYVGDIESQGKGSWKQFTLHLLTGNGRRPFPAASGYLSPDSFRRFVSNPKQIKGVTPRVMTVPPGGLPQPLAFTFLSKPYRLVLEKVMPCEGCEDRVQIAICP